MSLCSQIPPEADSSALCKQVSTCWGHVSLPKCWAAGHTARSCPCSRKRPPRIRRRRDAGAGARRRGSGTQRGRKPPRAPVRNNILHTFSPRGQGCHHGLVSFPRSTLTSQNVVAALDLPHLNLWCWQRANGPDGHAYSAPRCFSAEACGRQYGPGRVRPLAFLWAGDLPHSSQRAQRRGRRGLWGQVTNGAERWVPGVRTFR